MRKSSYGSIYTMFEYINTHILSDNKLKKGGDPNDTEPYNTFHTVLDNAYDYLNFVFKNRDENRQEYENSIANLNEKCDCSQYKCKPETPIESNAAEGEMPEEDEEPEEPEEPEEKKEEEPEEKEEEPEEKKEVEEPEDKEEDEQADTFVRQDPNMLRKKINYIE